MHERNSTLRIVNKELKIGFGSKALEAVEKQATELQSEVKWLKAELGTSEQHRKDLELVVNSVDAELLEVRDSRHRLEDEILSLTKNVELLQSELKAEGGKVMTKYKASSGFQVELEKMGQVTYEFRYWAVLERFQAKYPDSSVKEDPFNEHLEDTNVRMELSQAFDDSTPTEE
ncbi:hypothetical protein GW17_00043952 [Ensete ventricosum]|nr:hypothetical protein GW17_00043952 [Ensete ventricosum]